MQLKNQSYVSFQVWHCGTWWKKKSIGRSSLLRNWSQRNGRNQQYIHYFFLYYWLYRGSEKKLTLDINLDSVTSKYNAAMQAVNIGWSISEYGTRIFSQSEKSISQKMSRMKQVESEAEILQQAGIVRFEHNPGLKKEFQTQKIWSLSN